MAATGLSLAGAAMLLAGVLGIVHAGEGLRDPGGATPPALPGSVIAAPASARAMGLGWSAGSGATGGSRTSGEGHGNDAGRAGAAGEEAAAAARPDPGRHAVPVSGTVAMRSGRWVWPLDPRPRVTRGFEPPSQRWSAGHRGVDLTPRGSPSVRAVETGVVTHVGWIAGRPTISVTHPSGIRSTYEPVTSELTRGARVSRGSPIGELVDTGSHCTPTCLHLGAIHGETYLDPLRFLDPVTIILLPLEP